MTTFSLINFVLKEKDKLQAIWLYIIGEKHTFKIENPNTLFTLNIFF